MSKALTLTELLKLQSQVQQVLKQNGLAVTLPNELKNIGELSNFLFLNKQAYDAEFTEIIDALPGIEHYTTKERSALWKTWKASHKKMQSLSTKELTANELEHIKEEFADSFLFIINMMLALGITEDDLIRHCANKIEINMKRYQSAY